MKLELFNEYVWRILISCRPQDSISAISKRIGLSYGWTHKWVSELVKEGVFRKKGKGIELSEENAVYERFLGFFSETAEKSVPLHYSVLRLFGLKYAFTETDAVFFWTKGGYNIARDRGHYPIFIKVRTDELKLWKYYFEKMHLKRSTNVGAKGVFFVLRPCPDFEVARVGDTPVVPLKEAIEFMKKYEYNFLPALEMVSPRARISKYAEVSGYA